MIVGHLIGNCLILVLIFILTIVLMSFTVIVALNILLPFSLGFYRCWHMLLLGRSMILGQRKCRIFSSSCCYFFILSSSFLFFIFFLTFFFFCIFMNFLKFKWVNQFNLLTQVDWVKLYLFDPLEKWDSLNWLIFLLIHGESTPNCRLSSH